MADRIETLSKLVLLGIIVFFIWYSTDQAEKIRQLKQEAVENGCGHYVENDGNKSFKWKE